MEILKPWYKLDLGYDSHVPFNRTSKFTQNPMNRLAYMDVFFNNEVW